MGVGGGRGLPQSCALNVFGNIFNREIDLVDSVVEWSVYRNVRRVRESDTEVCGCALTH